MKTYCGLLGNNKIFKVGLSYAIQSFIVITEILYCIQYFTWSFYRDANAGELWSHFAVHIRTLATIFWISLKVFRPLFGHQLTWQFRGPAYCRCYEFVNQKTPSCSKFSYIYGDTALQQILLFPFYQTPLWLTETWLPLPSEISFLAATRGLVPVKIWNIAGLSHVLCLHRGDFFKEQQSCADTLMVQPAYLRGFTPHVFFLMGIWAWTEEKPASGHFDMLQQEEHGCD